MYLYNDIRLKPLFGDRLPWEDDSKEEDSYPDIESIKREAYLQGHREGYEKGREEAEEKARNILKQIEERHKTEMQTLVEEKIKRLDSIIDHTSGLRKEIISRADKDILEIAILIAKKIVKLEISQDREQIILNNIREALKNAVDKDHVIVRLNPEDYELLRSMKGLKELLEVKEVILQKEASISKGGCIVETSYSHIDAQIESQLETIEKNLRDQR